MKSTSAPHEGRQRSDLDPFLFQVARGPCRGAGLNEHRSPQHLKTVKEVKGSEVERR